MLVMRMITAFKNVKECINVNKTFELKGKLSAIRINDQTERHLNKYITIGPVKQGCGFSHLFGFVVSRFLVFFCLCVCFVGGGLVGSFRLVGFLLLLFLFCFSFSNKCRIDMET